MAVPASAAGKPRRPSRWRAVLAWALALCVFLVSVHYGIQLRRWAWDQTDQIRFLNSVSNAIEWGRHANRIGVLNVYDDLVARHGTDGDYSGPARFALDYAPLRLFIATSWAKWAEENFPPPPGKPLTWQREYEFTWPMLRINLACELAASIGIFLVVYHWMRTCRTPAPRRWWRWGIRDGWGLDEASTRDMPSTVGLFPGLLAALLLWFNPAVIVNAHVYPQWDAWLLPSFIFAVYFGLRNWWLPAGIVVGICAMAKGQILFALPLLIAWPLLLGNIAGVVRVIVGLGTGLAIVVWPFLLRSYESIQWIFVASVAAVLLAGVAALPRSNWKWQVFRGAIALGAISLLFWPVTDMTGEYLLQISSESAITIHRRSTLLGVIALAATAAIVGGRRWIPTLLAGLPGICTLLTIPLLNASISWFLIGTIYPTRHWKQLFWCHGANLGTILQQRFGWKYADVVDLSWLPLLNLQDPVPLRHIMMSIYVVMLTVLIIAFVRHRRWHDPKLLLAMAAPFMLAYTFLPQMIERYLMWPAAILSAYAAINVGALALSWTLSLIAAILMFSYIIPFVRQTEMAKEWLPYIRPFFPDISWAIIVFACVMLYMAVTPSRSRREALRLESN